jgi:hypothetical protein
VAPATYAHALAQGDFGGHHERNLDFGPFPERGISEEEDSARTEILGEAEALNGSSRLAERKGKKVQESLSHTAFNSNWKSGHASTSFAEPPQSVLLTVAHGGWD